VLPMPMRICSEEKCSDLVLLCPNHRPKFRLYRDAMDLLANRAGSKTQWRAIASHLVVDEHVRRGSTGDARPAG